MRTKAIVTVIVTFVAVSLTPVNLYADSQKTLAQAAVHLSNAKKHIESENFRAAEDALLQANREIEPLNRWYTWPSVKTAAASLRADITRSKEVMTQQITALTGTLNAVADHLRNRAHKVAETEVIAAQQATGKPSRNLGVVSDLLKRLVVQDFGGAKEDLTPLRQNLPERGGGAEAVSELQKVVQGEQTRFAEQLLKPVRDIGESLSKGDITRAQKTMEAMQKSFANSSVALTAVAEFMQRLQAQDFTGAEKHLSTLRRHLPEGDIGAEVVSVLERSMRAEQARLAELIRKAVHTIGESLNKGDFARAQKTVETAQTSFANPNATLTGIAEFVRRIRVQNFIGADSLLPTIPTTLPDGSRLQEMSEMLGKVVKKEREANLATQASIARNVDALVQKGSIDRSFKPVLQGCGFHAKAATDSTGSLPRIPRQSCHGFHSNPATDSR